MTTMLLSPEGQRTETLLRARWLSAALLWVLGVLGAIDALLIWTTGQLLARKGFVPPKLGGRFDVASVIMLFATATAYFFFVWWLGHRSGQLSRLRAVGASRPPRFVVVTSLLPVLTAPWTHTFVSELWRSSSPSVDFKDTHSWRHEQLSSLVGRWWTFFMATGFVTVLWLADYAHLSRQGAIDQDVIRVHFWLTLVLCMIQLVAVRLTIQLVHQIDRRQLERFRIIQRRYEAQTPGPVGTSTVGFAASAPLTAAHCFKALGMGVAFEALFILVTLLFKLPPWVHLFSTQVILVAVALTLSHSEGVPLRRLVSWSRPRWRDLAGASLVAAGILCFNAAWLLPWIERLLVVPDRHEALRKLVENLPASEILLPLLIVVIAPVVEEVLFRGVLFEALSTALPSAMVVVLTAAIFALIHGNLPQIIATFILGLHCGFVRAATGSISAPILVHLLNNLGAITFLPDAVTVARRSQGVLALPVLLLFLAGYGLLLRASLNRAWAAAGDAASTVTGAPRPQWLLAAQLWVRFTVLQTQRGSLTHLWLKATAVKAAPILLNLRRQLLGGPLAHGLAVGLALLYTLRYLFLTSQSWRQTGAMTLAIAAYFGYWAFSLWRERKLQTALFLILFLFARLIIGAATRGPSFLDLLAVIIFALGTLAVFRGYPVQQIRHESVIHSGSRES